MRKMLMFLGVLTLASSGCGDTNITNIVDLGDGDQSSDTTTNGGNTTKTAKWISGFTPTIDSAYVSETIVFSNALAYIPAGKNQDMEITTGQCSAVVSTSRAEIAPDTFKLGFAVMVIANCTDSIRVRLKANLNEAVVVRSVGRTAPIQISVSISPKGDTVAVGGFGRSYCTLTAPVSVTDRRCWFYSTNPSVKLVVQKDQTYPAGTPVWGGGFRNGGEEASIGVGEAMVCVYWVLDPKVSDCALRVVTGPSGVSSFSSSRVVGITTAVPEALRSRIRIPSGHRPYIR